MRPRVGVPRVASSADGAGAPQRRDAEEHRHRQQKTPREVRQHGVSLSLGLRSSVSGLFVRDIRRRQQSRLVSMHIDIWSDVVCPWCYLGKRRLEKALSSFDGKDDVTIAHRAFQLDPTKPRGETANRRTMLMSKYRLTEDRVREMDRNMEVMAAAEGLEYHLTEKGQTGNTLETQRHM